MNKVIPILKTIGVIVGSATTIWIVFAAYDNFRDGQIEQLNNDKVIIENLNEFKSDISTRLDSISRELKSIHNKQASLEGSFYFYRNNVDRIDKEQMEQIIIDAYGMGYEVGKKKELTASDLLGGI